MGTCGCGESTVGEDDPSGGSAIEQNLGSELPVQSVPVHQSCSEGACHVLLDSDAGLSNMKDVCRGPSREGHGRVGSASFINVTEMSGLVLAGECENLDTFLLEKTMDDDGGDRLIVCCGKIEDSSLESGGLCLEENFQDEGNCDMPSEFITVNGLQKHCVQQGEEKDDKSNIFPSAGDALAVVNGENDDAGSPTDSRDQVLDFRNSELSLEPEPVSDMLFDCNQLNEQENIMRNEDPLSKVEDKCDALGGMEMDACKQISPSHGEVPLDVLYTEMERGIDQQCDKKDGEDWNNSFEEKIKDFVDKESIIDTYVEVLSSPRCQRTLGSSSIANLPSEPTLLDQENDIDLEMKTNILQIEDKFCKLKDCSSEAATDCTLRKPFYPESGQPSVVVMTNSYSKEVPDLLPKGDNGSINYNSAVDDHGQTDNEGKHVVEADSITEGISMPSQRNSRRTKSGLKTQTRKASRKCKNKAIVTHPGEDMKIILEAARRKRSCFSKPARTSIWGLPGNIKQFFEQDNELGIGAVMCQGLGKARSSRKSGKTKNGATSSSLSLVQKGSVSTTRVRLKIKDVDLSCSTILIPEVVDGLASASGSQKLASNTEGKSSEEVTFGKFESFQNNPDKEALILTRKIANSQLESTREKSDGHKSGKAKKGASSSSLSSVQKCSVSTTRVRLKIKDVDLSHSTVLIPEVVDGLATASNLGSGSGSEKLVSNTEGKSSEVVALGKFESSQNNLDKDALVLTGKIANGHLDSTREKSDGDDVVLPESLVEPLIEPINDKGMDLGTSPDSEVINSIPEVQVGERHQEDVHHTVLGSFEGFNSHLDVTGSKRGKKKDKLTCSGNCISEDGSQGRPRKNRAKQSKNSRRKKNFSDAVSSLELPTSTEKNASCKSVSCKELSTELLPLSERIELEDSAESLKVKSCTEVQTSCNPSVDHGFSESRDSENLLSSAGSLGRKLPQSLKPSKASRTKSKASDSPSRKKSTCRRRGKYQKPINKSEVQQKSISDKVMGDLEDHPHTANDAAENYKSEAVGKNNAGDNRVSTDVSNLDVVPGVGLGEQNLSPHNAWVRCDDCHKWRRIPVVLADRIEDTKCTWTCKDSNDKAFADCSIPQEKSNAEINAELGLSDASGEEDAYEDSKNYKELECRPPVVSQESTFTCISTNEFLHRSRKSQTIDEIMVCHCKPPPNGKLGCGDECLNRMLNIECVQGTCPCGDHCSNQQFQKRKYASLKWFKCGKKGYGLKALEDIAKGQFLIEYVGEVLDVHAYEARQREYALKGHRHFYFMTLNGSEVIDASAKGNLGRFINHSCDPNCRTEKWMVNGEICIGLFALRDIKQDEEVTFDYNYVRVFGAAAKKCYCGSPQCRGYIGGDPLNAEVIVHGDSDEEFREPVMLTEDGEIEDSVPTPRHLNSVGKQTARHMLKERDVSDKSTTATGPDCTSEKESFMNPVSAISQSHGSLAVEDSKSKLPSSVQVEEVSQQMEDVTSKPMPGLREGYAMESELADKTSSIQRLETTSSPTTVSKVLSNSIDSNRESKSEVVEGGHDFSQSHLFVKTPRLNGSVKKGKVRANPPNGLKAEVATNRLQVSSIKLKRIEGPSNGRFEAVREKLNELLDGDGGISKRKDATKGYLKLLLLTVASGDRSNGEAIQSNRDLSMILDALLKTKSRAVLNDIINKNGLQMLHNIMKQYRWDFKKIPILRKLLKVLEYLAASKILTFEHINGGPPCHGMESFRESMLSLTEHDDKQVHQIARNFRDRWIPRPVRKHGYMDRDDSRVEFHKSFNCNRILTSHNSRHELDSRSTEAIDCVQQSMLVTTLVDAGNQEACSTKYLDGGEVKGTKKRKRRSRWDQPAETNSRSASYPSKEQKIDSGLLKQTDAVISCADERQNTPDDAPPGFSCPLGSLNASLYSGDLPLQNAGHSWCPSDAVIGHPKQKFNSYLPVSYGMPWSVAQQYGTPHAEITGSWFTAPGMPFNPFPPLPTYPRVEKDCEPSNTSNASTIDQPAEVGLRDTSGAVNCYLDDMFPSTTDANPEDMNLPYEDNKDISKRLKGSSYDLGRRYFRQQKWNNSKISRPWFRRNAWKCNADNSRDGMCSISVGNASNESKVRCYSEDALCRTEKDGNNII